MFCRSNVAYGKYIRINQKCAMVSRRLTWLDIVNMIFNYVLSTNVHYSNETAPGE
jgi:hypothetical protein